MVPNINSHVVSQFACIHIVMHIHVRGDHEIQHACVQSQRRSLCIVMLSCNILYVMEKSFVYTTCGGCVEGVVRCACALSCVLGLCVFIFPF